jgi:hypothetical protein
MKTLTYSDLYRPPKDKKEIMWQSDSLIQIHYGKRKQLSFVEHHLFSPFLVGKICVRLDQQISSHLLNLYI